VAGQFTLPVNRTVQTSWKIGQRAGAFGAHGEVVSMSYAGDVNCRECWDLLSSEPKAQLIDVRTSAEWNFVGVPDLASIGREPILIEWQRYPDMAVNPVFVQALSAELNTRGVTPQTPLLFLCRSGARSQSAAVAMSAAGYGRSYNVAGGFEGARDAAGHRGTVEGWKFDSLPWMQR
jgi:rhodanese-related sulfurtransferase